MLFNHTRTLSFISLLSLIFFVSCSSDDDPKPFTINFTNVETGLSIDNPSLEVSITFSRPSETSGVVELALSSTTLTYGSTADYYTVPELSNDMISIAFEKGAESVSFILYQGESLNIQQDETISFDLVDSGKDFNIGENVSVTIVISENYIAPSGTIGLDAGGENWTLQNFVDLSKLTSVTVDKYSWDLGFYTKAGDHSVIINGPAFNMARMLDANDLNAVTSADTMDFGAQMIIPQFDPSVGAMAWVDGPDGDLSQTAFGTISATASENKVFIIKRDGEGRNWKKVRVLQNADGYTVEYADIDATTFESQDIAKDEDYNFIFFDLDNGLTSNEPKKDEWDIQYGSYTELFPLGIDLIPYGFLDYILINRNNVSVAMVMLEDITYENFGTNDVDGLNFLTEINSLGSTWRSGGGPTSGPSLYDDRFFVLEDAQGNVYKILFTRLTSAEGERGLPEFIFELVN